MTGCKSLLRGEFGHLLPSLFGCHMAYMLSDTRFKNFSHIIRVWPDCSEKMLEVQQNDPSVFLVTDEELVGICIIIYGRNIAIVLICKYHSSLNSTLKLITFTQSF